jgi:integrase
MATVVARYSAHALYIMFRYKGVQYSKKSEYQCERKGDKNCTCRSCASARRLAKSVQDAIDLNLFEMSRYFTVPIERQPASVLLFKDYAESWLSLNIRLSYSTRETYKPRLKTLYKLLGEKTLLVDVNRLQVKQIIKRLSDEGLAPKTVNHFTGLLSTILNDAVDNDLIPKNPARKLMLPIPQREVQTFTPNDVLRILEVIREAKPSLLLYFAIGFFTGARSGEIIALRKEDIDLEKNVIRFGATVTRGLRNETTKTKRIRYVEILPQLYPFILWHLEYMAERDFTQELFLKDNDEPITSYKSISKYWTPALAALGLPHQRQYDLRHAFSSNMVAAQIDHSIIASVLGHSSLKMLYERYGNRKVRNLSDVSDRFTAYMEEWQKKNEHKQED